MFDRCKKGFAAILALVIISVAGKAWAYPVPTIDFKRIISSVQVTMNQTMQIKQEVESNINIVKEAQNTGYAAAAGDLFTKVQDGELDRFGNDLKGFKESTNEAANSVQKLKEQKEKLSDKRQLEEVEELAKEKAAKDRGDAIAEESHKSFFGRNYNWIKGNRLATDSAVEGGKGTEPASKDVEKAPQPIQKGDSEITVKSGKGAISSAQGASQKGANLSSWGGVMSLDKSVSSAKLPADNKNKDKDSLMKK